ncbi:hypothetical protein NHP190012_14180 [Helicobacter sp. NHP19-012]|uniref:Uncharacterized protein n=1 Tax=Helicobacter gastrofelis TaxID=2849642 RepID=A0ABM7SHD9_9HELI|nr:hypothetical protein NHP190012_14180 [Helicobacter sp. NHP19-012]
MQDVFDIVFKIQPRAAIGDDLPGVNEFIRTGGGFFLFKNHPRASVQLIDHNPLNSINNKGSAIGH